jgi:hypothetical protein
MRLLLLLLLLTTALLAAIPAAGQTAGHRPAPEVWATVNVCDTATHPNKIGIRGNMAGLARRTAMYMRFRVQFRDMDGRWRTVKLGADSRWQRVAIGRRGQHDAGWTFEFRPPTAGGAHVLRGVVSFQWRHKGHVVRRDRRITEGGHPGTRGADPPDFSAETCEIA